jgi:NitT/TauT family transport system ATP-binding protein
MIEAIKIRKSFLQDGKELKVLAGMNLRAEDGEFVSFFGPNGCGKTTLLLIVAGIEQADAGEIRINGKPPEESRAGFVFQNFHESLFPWKTVAENVEFALEARGVGGEEKKKMAAEYLSQVNLVEHAHKYPYQLSGGLRQLTAIARALAFEPDFFLMDEPFSALDYQTRLFMEEEILKIWKRTGKTFLFVSHDVDEAVFLSDRVVVFSRRPARVKKIVEVDLPRPRTLKTRLRKEFFEKRNEVLEAFKGELGEVEASHKPERAYHLKSYGQETRRRDRIRAEEIK